MLNSSKSAKTLAVLLISTAIAPLAFAGNLAAPGYTPDLVPSNPTAGECYARVEVPAQYSEGSQQVMTEEAYSTIDVQQAQLASRQEQVMIKEASTRYRVRQPTYRSTTEQKLVRPAYDKLSVSAPQFSTVTERVQSSAPRLIWKRGNPGKLKAQGYKIHTTADAGYRGQGYSSSAQFATTGGERCGDNCEIWCLVEEPGEAVEYNRKVMTSPGRVQRTSIPAKYQTIHKQVVSDPGGVEEIPVQAEYRSVTVQDVIHPGGENSVHVPAKYAEVATKTLISPERYEWRRVLCAPGTGTIKSSADFATSSSSHVSSTSSATYSAPTSTYGSSRTYGETSYSTPQHTTSTYSAPRSSQPVVTGSGYYNGYNSGTTAHDCNSGINAYESSPHCRSSSHGSAHNRKRARRR